MLKISDDLSLPIEAVTQTFAVLAKRGAGKTYCASVMAEEMLATHQQIVVVDPTGAWFGLRSSADGKSAGFPIVVIGGEHGDVPLSETAGEVIAQSIVEHRFSAILDLSQLRKGQVRRFLTPFLETLYRLNREPLHLFIDEADYIAPQGQRGDEAPAVGAVEDVVKRGRRRGIGCTLITQRPADLAKQVLTQCEVLVPLRLVHPRDINAIKEWINVHAEPDQAKQVIDSLPSLPIGTAWVWSPGWLDKLLRVQIRRRTTFDSSATPKVGEAPRRPKKLAEIDVQALGEQIAATVKEAKTNDPKELKRRILELEKQLAERPAVTPERVEVPVLSARELMLLDSFAGQLEAAATQIGKVSGETRETANLILAKLDQVKRTAPTNTAAKPRPTVRQPTLRQPAASSNGTAGTLSSGERKILNALAQYPGGRTKVQVAVLTHYAHNGGGFNNYLGALRSKAFIVGDGDRLQITDEGLDALGDIDPLPTGQDLLAHWLPKLSKAERLILETVAANFPAAMSKEDVAAATGYEPSGGGFNNALGKLRTLELISGRGVIRASDSFFE
jgi:hypothetical protein